MSTIQGQDTARSVSISGAIFSFTLLHLPSPLLLLLLLHLQVGCGDCFNGNGRSSDEKFNVVKCPIDDPTGYYCNPEGESFACMDWTFGSNKMKQAEETFNRRV